MATTLPIKLGSALQPRLIFQEGSSITISDSGIQESSIKAICPDAANVFAYIPAAGATFNNVFGNNYLPADFKVDRSKDSSVQITYDKGTTATITLSFKRPDPDKTGAAASRKVSFDTQFKHIGDLLTYLVSQGTAGLDDTATSFGTPGIPEPVVTVRYNNPTLPVIGAAGFTGGSGSTTQGSWGGALVAPGSSQALGFPTCEPVALPYSDVFAVAGSGSGCVIRSTATVNFIPNPLGWQLVGLAAEPIADQSFFDVTETWRMNYVFANVSNVTTTQTGDCA